MIDLVLIPLRPEGFTKVSPEVAERPEVRDHAWRLLRRPGKSYARRRGPRPEAQTIYLHRVILGLPPGRAPQVDHIDGDGLNNLEDNLRLATPSQNLANMPPRRGTTSAFKGVSLGGSRIYPWVAYISVKGRTRRIGGYATEIEAAVAYDEAARELHGPFAWVNFP